MFHSPTADSTAPSATVDPDLVATLRAVLVQFPRVRLALLFGSRATGRAHAHSDIDLAVLAPEADRLALADALADAMDRDIDLVALDTATIPLIEELLRTAVIVHEGTPGAAACWRSATLVDLELDRIWYRRHRDAWLARVATQGLTW